MPKIKTGLDKLLKAKNKSKILGKAFGLVVHPASIDKNYKHTSELLSHIKGSKLISLFGPQHGARGEKQDNMIESDDYKDSVLKIPVYSLYGKTRTPTEKMLKNIEQSL